MHSNHCPSAADDDDSDEDDLDVHLHLDDRDELDDPLVDLDALDRGHHHHGYCCCC
jgi:hypothetical protein